MRSSSDVRTVTRPVTKIPVKLPVFLSMRSSSDVRTVTRPVTKILVQLPTVGLAQARPNKLLGECSALWGEREGVVWYISVPLPKGTAMESIALPFPTSHITIVSFSGLPHL